MNFTQPLIVINSGGTPMYLTIHTIACTYVHSGILIESHGDEQGEIRFTFPATMCQSFAIELFLKFFIAVDFPEIHCEKDAIKYKVNLKGHAYSVLWSRVSSHYQERIAHRARMNVHQFGKLLLDIGDDPFVGWRYVYEKEQGFHPLPFEKIKQVADALGYASDEVMVKIKARSKG